MPVSKPLSNSQSPTENVRRFVSAMSHVEFSGSAAPAAMRHLLQLFALPGVDYEELAQPATSLIASDPSIRSWLEPHRGGSTSICSGELLRALDVPLVHALLRNAIVRDLPFEALMSAVRRKILSIAYHGDAETVSMELAVSLACQCFITEYVYATEESEEQQVDSMSSKLTRWLDGSGDALDDLAIAVCAMYQPLWLLDPGQRFLQLSTEISSPVLAPLISIQVADHWEESGIKSRIPVIAMSEDAVSLAVRRQYEESPYPRWFSIWEYQPKPFLEVLRSSFPLIDYGPAVNGFTELLVAGCGTGKHPIKKAMQYSNVHVLAVDLSRASLAYAIRMARRLGISNVEFAQGDILALDRLERDFHLIDAFGVLHHMADPASALTILAHRLKPGGFIALAVYNRAAWRSTRLVIRSLPVPENLTQTNIRAARHEVIRLLDASDPLFLGSYEIFTASDFRDQFLHAHARDFTLPEIALAIQKAGLHLIGLRDLQPAAEGAFRARFPDLRSMNDLERLAEFDREYPNPCRGWLYKVLAQKR